MPSRYEISYIRDQPERHIAATAWRRFDGSRRGATSIEVLKPEYRKSAVFRVNGVGPAGAAVVAKRGAASELAMELRIYTELLPTVPIPVLQLYGALHDEDDALWLFLEDVGETWYSPADPTHRSLAVSWLAGLHTADVGAATWLERTGMPYFSRQLDAAIEGMHLSLTHVKLSPAEVEMLKGLLVGLEGVARRWPDIANALDGLPEGLVHGDFVPKNVRVHGSGRQRRLVGFDWETAGVAAPAADLALVLSVADRRAYARLVREVWPGVTGRDVEHLAQIGVLLRLIHAVRWETRSFRHDWIHRAVENMRVYGEALGNATRQLGWGT